MIGQGKESMNLGMKKEERRKRRRKVCSEKGEHQSTIYMKNIKKSLVKLLVVYSCSGCGEKKEKRKKEKTETMEKG